MGAIGQGGRTSAGGWLRIMRLERVIQIPSMRAALKAEDTIARNGKLTEISWAEKTRRYKR